MKPSQTAALPDQHEAVAERQSMPAAQLVAHDSREERAATMDRDGFVFFPTVISKEEVRELRACSDRIQTVEIAGWDSIGSNGNGIKTIQNSFNRDALYLDYLDKPGVIELVEDVLGDDCHIIQMTQWNTGRREDQGMHADWKPIVLPDDVGADPRVNIPALIMTAHFYLDDMYEDLGPTRVIPGTHRAGSKPHHDSDQWNNVQEQSILCKAGDVIVFRSDLWHRGGANRTDQVRYLLQVHYANRWIAQRFPPFLSFQFNPEILSQATPRQRRLLGEHRAGPFA
jgi:hypothetical protein